MVDPQPIAKHQALAATCMHCGYDLRGSPSERCPECGKVFDLALVRRRSRQRWFISIATMALVMYAPFGWLLFVNDDPGYVRHWMLLWPLLPGLVPTSLLAVAFTGSPFSETATCVLSGVIALAALVGFSWLGQRSRKALIIWAAVFLMLSSVNGYIALKLFQM